MFLSHLHKYASIGLISIISMWFTSCKVTRDVKNPPLELPEAFRDSDDSPALRDSIIPWKTFFSEPLLKGLIDTALVRNNDMLTAIQNINAAQKTFVQAKLGYLPQINLNVAGTSNRPSDNSLNGLTLSQFLGSSHVEDYTAAALLSWEADIWGKVRNEKKDTFSGYLQTLEARKAIQTRLVSDISKGYYNLIMLDAQVNISRENLELNTRTLNMIKLQYEAGEVTYLAVGQAEAQQLLAEKFISQFEQEITIQENAISLLLGKSPQPIARSSSLDQVFTKTGIAAGVPSTLLQMRPDVKSAQLQVNRANAKVGIEKANMYPSLTITAQGGLNAFKASDWFSLPSSLFGNVVGGIAQPVLNGRKLRTRYELAQIEREKAIIGFKQQVLIAVSDVSDALVKIKKLAQQRSAEDRRTTVLKQTTQNAEMLFKSGRANYLEVITAQSNVLQSELELAQTKRAQLNATVELYRSMGGGWQ